MRVFGLISGGKDSIFGLIECIRNGHEVVLLGNLAPPTGINELDSFMYQTVGHECIDLLAEALNVPLIRRVIRGSSLSTSLGYEKLTGDEVEDLHRLVEEALTVTDFEAVSTGAIASNYQRIRVENVCHRLGLYSLAYLWERDQCQLLLEMDHAAVDAILVKIASHGLSVDGHLAKSIRELSADLQSKQKLFGLNPCGEGGEFETLTLDCCLFEKRLSIKDCTTVLVNDDNVCPVAHLAIKSAELIEKSCKPFVNAVDRSFLYEMGEQYADICSCCLARPSSLRAEKRYQSCVEVSCTAGVLFITSHASVSSHKDISAAYREAISLIEKALPDGYKLSESLIVNFYLANMDNFTQLSNIYAADFWFKPKFPPARSCVESDPSSLTIFCVIPPSESEKLFIQSISHWAPANIAPYSQYASFGGTVFISGQIPMIPASLKLCESDQLLDHALLSLHHCKVLVMKRFRLDEHDCQWTEYVSAAVVYVTHEDYFPCVRRVAQVAGLESSSVLVCVPALPRGAPVEWEMMCVDSSASASMTFSLLTGNMDDVSEVGTSSAACRVFYTQPAHREALAATINSQCKCFIRVTAVDGGDVAAVFYDATHISNPGQVYR